MTSKPKKSEQPAEAATVVYCGPTIPGVAKQFTVFQGGLPAPLAEAIKKTPAMGELIIPPERLPNAMLQLREGSGPIYRLYRLVQATTDRR